MKAQIQNSLFMVSEIKVSYQPKFKACERPKIIQSKDAYNILFNNWDQGRIELSEQFFILLLNRANNVIGMAEISSGGIAGTVVDPKLVFGIALKSCASGIILCHNHPSSNLKPSEADLTKRGYFSFGDEGLI